jgi:hypothetical protein
MSLWRPRSADIACGAYCYPITLELDTSCIRDRPVQSNYRTVQSLSGQKLSGFSNFRVRKSYQQVKLIHRGPPKGVVSRASG